MASNTMPEKATQDNIDVVENLRNTSTYLDENAASGLSQEHREYLLQRHGTLDLDPVPGMGGADPYNWPLWKVSLRPMMISSMPLIVLTTVESNQPRVSGHSCVHVHFHSSIHHSGVRNHCNGPRGVLAASNVSDVSSDRNPWSSSSDLEAFFEYIWPPPLIPVINYY
jgi:hypothetical protein